jgi:tetratricopeptide (TPR) repeat protein
LALPSLLPPPKFLVLLLLLLLHHHHFSTHPHNPTTATQGRYQDAETKYREALRIRKQKLGPESLEVAAALNNLGGNLGRQRRWDEAEATHREALRITELKLGPNSRKAATTLWNLGSMSDQQGKLEEAQAYAAALRPLYLCDVSAFCPLYLCDILVVTSRNVSVSARKRLRRTTC